jgi:hypothetical protein
MPRSMGVALLTAMCFVRAIAQQPPQAPSNEKPVTSPQSTPEGETTGWAEVVAHVRPAVVVIESDKALGSGFVVRPDGVIITNHHVVADATKMAVKFASGEVYRKVYLLSSDPIEDLAFLKIEAVDLPTIPLGNSNDVAVGEDVLLVGAPRGLEQTVSNGLISGIRLDEGVRVLQTSAAASPGSSGGPLLNLRGEAIGVMSFKVVNGENLNFTIPINYVRGKLETLSMSAQQRTFEPLLSPQAEKRPGVWVAGYGYPAGSFDYVYMELIDLLGSSNVELANTGPQKTASVSETGYTPLSDILAAISKSGAGSLLYVKVEDAGRWYPGLVNVHFQCFDSSGKLLWEENASRVWPNGNHTGLKSGWKSKVIPHIGGPGLLLKQTSPESQTSANK